MISPPPSARQCRSDLPAPSGQSSGILSGLYCGSTGYTFCTGDDQLSVLLKQSGDQLSGMWQAGVVGPCDVHEIASVEGTFDPKPTVDGGGTVSLNLAEVTDFGPLFLQAVVTAADGSQLAGRLLECDPARCSSPRTVSDYVSLTRVSR